MKLSSAIILASLSTTTAFVTPKSAFTTTSSVTSISMSDESFVEQTSTSRLPQLPLMSQSLPFMERPAALDGTLAGDVGFDPLGFAKNKDDLIKYREAEIKHARLAMLAAAGWPLSELFDTKLAGWLGMSPLLQSADRAPSILNGGLGQISPVYWVVCLAAAAAIDLYGIFGASKKPGYGPGNLGFDPLGVFPKDKDGQDWFQLAELKNGRLAMIAITAFAVQELVTQSGVVDATPLFFKPLPETLANYANSGYIQ